MTSKLPRGAKTSARRGLQGTVYKRGNKWAFMLQIAPDPLSGKRRQRAKSGFASETDAWDALAEANAQLRADTFVSSSARTVAEFLEEWLATVAMTVKPTTLANYTVYARSYVIPHIGSRRIQEVEPATVSALYRLLLTSGRRKPDTNSAMYEVWKQHRDRGEQARPADIARTVGVSYSAASIAVRRYREGRTPTPTAPGLAARTVVAVHVMLRHALGDAVEHRLLSSNPAARVKPPRVKSSRHSTWTPAELGRFLAAARTDRFSAMWLLFATTGMRRSEAVGALRSAFDPAAETLTVISTRVIAAGKAQRSDGKSHRSRRLLGLDPTTVAALRRHLQEQDEERTAFGTSYTDEDLLFCWPDGSPLYPDTITERFQRISREAGLPPIRLHDVRHTYATMALRAGVNPKIVSTRLGHATVAFTLETYTADIPELDQAAAITISNLFLPTEEVRPPGLDEDQDATG
ncbi:tyrosine-type recombinase/integrase [Pseudonocardia xishanensis]|uniref:Site-specific integrase n=1 Tax=Pseudonocardia xishanensis TaxID=630995 RepID=A0ABP8RU24_9PSEU